LNQATSAAWSGSATALEVHASTTSITPVAGNVTFFPQTAGAPLFGAAAVTTTATGTVHNYTADPLLTSGVVAIQNFDLPDMSTPYAATYDGSNSITGVAIANTAGALTSPAATQADTTTAQLAVKSVANQYVTDTAIAAVTDLLFSQPLRRYSAAVNYKSLSSTDAVGTTTTYATNTTSTRSQALYRGANGAGTDSAAVTGKGSAYYGPSSGTATATQGANLSIPSGGRNLCLTTINAPANNTIFDREEITPATTATSTSFVISPAPAAAAAATVRVCGEAAVISINNGGTTGASALGASLARSDFTSTSLTTYANGWVVFATNNGSTTGIPVLGQSFIRAANGAVNYGFSYANKVTR